jgi:hypothetical protein
MLKHRYITCIYSAIIYQLSTNSLQISCLKYDHGLTDNVGTRNVPGQMVSRLIAIIPEIV